MTNQDTYDAGFADGLRWVVAILRHSASEVEKPRFGDYQPRNGGPPVHAIAKVGQVHFATQLRAVAQTIEDAIGNPK